MISFIFATPQIHNIYSAHSHEYLPLTCLCGSDERSRWRTFVPGFLRGRWLGLRSNVLSSRWLAAVPARQIH
jgi:hypothetical protein